MDPLRVWVAMLVAKVDSHGGSEPRAAVRSPPPACGTRRGHGSSLASIS